MTQTTCPVCDTITAIKEPLDAGRIKQPRARRILDDILNLVQDIAWGMAGDDHLTAIEGLLKEMDEECTDPVGVEIRAIIHKELDMTMALCGERQLQNLGHHNLLHPPG